MSPSNIVLKNSTRRSTEIVASDPKMVRKSWHSGGLRSLGDGRRARREWRALKRASHYGLRVPSPRELKRNKSGWSLSMDRICAARPLSTVFAKARCFAQVSQPADCDLDLVRLANQMGSLVAQLATAGIEHRDLHPDNLLIDPQEQLWLVDFGQSKLRQAPQPKGGYRDLVTLYANIREHLNRRIRRMVVAAFYEMRGSLAQQPKNLDQRLETIERAARHERRVRVLRNLGRWLRTSGVVAGYASDGNSILGARYITDDQRQRPFSKPDGTRERFDGDRLTVQTTHHKVAIQAWMSAALMYEHSIRVARPLRLVAGNQACAEFEIPDGTHALVDVQHELLPDQLSSSYGELIGSMHERGLHPKSISEQQLLLCPNGQLMAMPGLEFKAPLRSQQLDEWAPELLNMSFLSDGTREPFHAAYQRALEGPLLGASHVSETTAPATQP